MADDRERKGVNNQIKGFGKQAEGKLRNKVGGMTGDSSEQIKGKAEELRGKTQRKIGEYQSDRDRNRIHDDDSRSEP
ncbi:MAG TPA: CsbD family protein [Gemmatimonadaceae bacterium]|jgi:uncharacterized protein YjbJ (UPF0337 family)